MISAHTHSKISNTFQDTHHEKIKLNLNPVSSLGCKKNKTTKTSDENKPQL